MSLNKKIAILIEDRYQDLEVWYPLLRFKEEGFQVITVEPNGRKNYKGKWGYPIEVDCSIDQVRAEDFEAVIIPGGGAPDHLRKSTKVLEFVKKIFDRGKIVASICHGGWVLASAGICKGKTLTSYIAIKDDMINAGANFVDKEVVRDGNLITSRTPDDLPAFCSQIVHQLRQGILRPQTAGPSK